MGMKGRKVAVVAAVAAAKGVVSGRTLVEESVRPETRYGRLRGLRRPVFGGLFPLSRIPLRRD